ncbi:MAG TPA: tRNA (adenosine(37)-N6)-threonylcarbamoyltransferase complex dimerization subunit type 1 TsaB [Pyrinomonadaceae bacterium]
MTPLILSVETATLSGSIAINRGAEVLASSSGNPDVSHSNTLLADIDRLLSTTNLTIRDMDVFAVASGPGSFTGLRIGIATIKALAATLSRSCIGVPTLEAIAHAAGPSARTVAMLPAGRGEVFCQMFAISSAGEPAELDQPAHLPPQKMIERYAEFSDILWTGAGAQLYKTLIQEARGGEARIVASDSALAIHVAALALRQFATDTGFGPNDLHAIYVRPSDAELKF